MSESSLANKIILVTGSARRIGAAIVTRLHTEGARVAIHYRGSAASATELADRLNASRPDSAAIFQADLLRTDDMPRLVEDVVTWGGKLDALVNNASTFYPTPVGEITESHWNDLVGSNFKAPLFLSQAFSVTLYAFGLAESLRILWAGAPVQLLAFVIVVGVGALAFRGADLALRIQVQAGIGAINLELGE